MSQNIAVFLQTLPMMGYGMAGIFIVMACIAAAMSLLKRFFK